MAQIHKIICDTVKSDWSVQNRGRLQELKQGFAIPIGNFKKGNFTPMHFGADNGTSDLFGDEIIYTIEMPMGTFRTDNPNGDRHLLPCYVEVKTIAYPKLSKDQVNFMNAQKARGAKCYVAMENEDKSEKLYTLTEWEIK